MALKSPLMPSPTAFTSAFSSCTDSPSSPAGYSSLPAAAKRSSTNSDSLQLPQSPYPPTLDPSPVDSNSTTSTAGTEIEDGDEDPVQPAAATLFRPQRPQQAQQIDPVAASSLVESPSHTLAKIDIDSAISAGAPEDGDPQSVIHAPSDSQQPFSKTTLAARAVATPSPTARSEATMVPASPEEERALSVENRNSMVEPLNTNVPNAGFHDHATPRAQSIQDFSQESLRMSRMAPSLSQIPETAATPRQEKAKQFARSALHYPQQLSQQQQQQQRQYHSPPVNEVDEETQKTIATLKTALSECWTLCNTLAGLSLTHRLRVFNFQGRSEMQETAWQSCWKLCQNLYHSRDEDHITHVLPTLEMCRDFCQALFDARQRSEDLEEVDSVLRVSFELNNHLYNAHDRSLPIAFQERTLDFYLTICHRLMKQRTSLPKETDSLLRACWSLAEMLFSLRQNNRDGKPADEDLLGSAVQACWDLCDLFRNGWTQIRPERGTPRATQGPFNVRSRDRDHRDRAREASSNSMRRPHAIPNYPERSASRQSASRNFQQHKPFPPETPTTIFDDANDDPLDVDETGMEPTVPNILVLGPDVTAVSASSTSTHPRWSSSASPHSGYSDTSSFRGGSMAKAGSGVAGSTSTATATHAGQDDLHVARIHALLVRTAQDMGYAPHSLSINPRSQQRTQRHSSNTSNTSSGTSTSNSSGTATKSATGPAGATAPLAASPSISSATKSPPSAASTFGQQSITPSLYALATATDPSYSSFVKSLPSNSFGSAVWQSVLLERYKEIVLYDQIFRGTLAATQLARLEHAASLEGMNTTSSSPLGAATTGNLVAAGVTSADIACAISWIIRAEQYRWLADLFRFVFGCYPEEVDGI